MNSLKRLNYGLFALMTVYALLDNWHTLLLIRTGLIKEVNPYMNFLITNYGIWAMYAAKLIPITILFVLIILLHKQVDRQVNKANKGTKNDN